MHYTHHTHHCTVDKARLDTLLASLSSARENLLSGNNAQAKALLDVACDNSDIAGIESLAAQLRQRFSHIVVIGAGGSGLSGRALACLKPSIKPCVHFLENIDPHAIDDMLARVELSNTHFIVISKSGSTVETLGHFYVMLELMTKTAKKAKEHFTIITMPGDNPLRESAVRHGMRVIDYAPNIGGRFSIFINVGLLPAAIAGLDIRAIRRGAAAVIGTLQDNSCPPMMGAALQYAFMEQGRNISVMLPYAERLAGFSSWYRQSWAESLGKNGKGTTPIRAVGTTDQHSQLQLYLDGPKDKLFHLITLKRAKTGHIFAVPGRDDLAYLKNKTTGDIIAAEQKATIETLASNGCPVRHFELDTLNEESLGALLMHFTLEIIFMAALLNVNPFDQPAVEEGKNLARDYLLTGNV